MNKIFKMNEKCKQNEYLELNSILSNHDPYCKILTIKGFNEDSYTNKKMRRASGPDKLKSKPQRSLWSQEGSRRSTSPHPVELPFTLDTVSILHALWLFDVLLDLRDFTIKLRIALVKA